MRRGQWRAGGGLRREAGAGGAASRGEARRGAAERRQQGGSGGGAGAGSAGRGGQERRVPGARHEAAGGRGQPQGAAADSGAAAVMGSGSAASCLPCGASARARPAGIARSTRGQVSVAAEQEPPALPRVPSLPRARSLPPGPPLLPAAGVVMFKPPRLPASGSGGAGAAAPAGCALGRQQPGRQSAALRCPARWEDGLLQGTFRAAGLPARQPRCHPSLPSRQVRPPFASPYS